MAGKTTGLDHGFSSPLAAGGGVRALAAQARRLDTIRQRLQAQLPAELSEGWQLARADAEALVVVTDSPARATRLRYARAQLLSAACACIEVRPGTLVVKPTPPMPARREQPKARLTEAAGAHLRQAVQGLEDERLRRALMKLARRARN